MGKELGLWPRVKVTVTVVQSLLVVSCCPVPFLIRLVPILSWLWAAENLVCCINVCEPDVEPGLHVGSFG